MTRLSLTTSRPRTATHRFFMAALLAQAAFFTQPAMALDAPLERAAQANTETAITAIQSIQLDVDGRTHKANIDLQRARAFTVDNRASKPELSEDTKRALRDMIREQSLKLADAGRVVVLGSNDDFSAPGRAGRTGFAAAKIIRDFLIAEGVKDERIMVAGWLAGRDDAGALSTLGSGGRAMVVLLASDQAKRVISIHGDPGRALAFDSAFARLTVARAGNGPTATAPYAAPAINSPATKPLDIRPVAAQPPVPRPAPVVTARAATPPVTAAPAARQPTVYPADLPLAVYGLSPLPAQTTVETPIKQAASRNAPQRVALDDFYPCGPIVACGQRHPSDRRRPVY